jgi:hypothetical protein
MSFNQDGPSAIEREHPMRAVVLEGIRYWLLTSVIAVGGVWFSYSHVRLHTPTENSVVFTAPLERFAAWDGWFYRSIATEGYEYDPKRISSIHFYPLFPLLSWCTARVTGLSIDAAMLVVTHLSLVGSFILFASYVRLRFPNESRELSGCVLLGFGLFPTTYYFRMAYTESTFLFLALLAMVGIQRKWPPVWIALIAGLSTAARSLGVGLALPLALYLWRQAPNKRSFLFRATLIMPIAGWGLASFMFYQWWEFGEPLAFAKSTVYFNERPMPASTIEYIGGLISLAPFRSVYDAACVCYWERDPPFGLALYNLTFANPSYFALAIALILFGAAKRWLNWYELALCVSFLGIPYLTTAYRNCMACHGRYAVVTFPMFIVLGHLMLRAPRAILIGVVGVSAFLLAAYAALFGSWYAFY